jgi:hypothetical protein
MFRSFSRYAIGAAAALLLAVALFAPLKPVPARAADFEHGDTACIPVKGQPKLSDLVYAGLSPDQDYVLIQNIGCADNDGDFTVSVALTDGTTTIVEETTFHLFLPPGYRVRVFIDFTCAFDAATISIDRANHVLESNEDNNVSRVTADLC